MRGLGLFHRTLAVTAVGLGLMAWSLVGCDQPAGQSAAPRVMPKTLTIITPHNEAIRYAFQAGFARWYSEAHADESIHIEWIYRGTPQCVDYVKQIPEMRSTGTGALPDLMFGGGLADHQALADDDFCQSLELGDVLADVPETINGLPTRDPQNRWFATGISSFGILYNQAACAARDIDPPQTWADLADPRFAGWLAIADPGASGSHRESLVIALQHLGWEQGWPVVQRMLANTRTLSGRSGTALGLVEDGQALATFAVNFDGLARVADSDGALAYVDPPDATVATPDVISVMTTSTHKPLATEFVKYVLSEEGQVLWSVAREHRVAPGDTLYHYPIKPQIYEKYADKLSVSANPLTTDFGVHLDPALAAAQATVIKELVPAACGKNHVALQKAWQAVIDAGLPAAQLAPLTAPPFPAAEIPELAGQLGDPSTRDEIVGGWSKTFADRYAAVEAAVE